LWGKPVSIPKPASTGAMLDSGGSLFMLPAGATCWSRSPLPTGALPSFQTLDDLILVVSGDQRGSQHMAIGLLDPERYLKASDGTSK
jgi:hypothetical protein